MYQFTKEVMKKKETTNSENKDKDNKDNKENSKPISNLTRSIKPTDSDARRGEEEDIMVPADKPGMVLTIHTWINNLQQQGPLTVKVIEKASVGQIIYVVLKLYLFFLFFPFSFQ